VVSILIIVACDCVLAIFDVSTDSITWNGINAAVLDKNGVPSTVPERSQEGGHG